MRVRARLSWDELRAVVSLKREGPIPRDSALLQAILKLPNREARNALLRGEKDAVFDPLADTGFHHERCREPVAHKVDVRLLAGRIVKPIEEVLLIVLHEAFLWNVSGANLSPQIHLD